MAIIEKHIHPFSLYIVSQFKLYIKHKKILADFKVGSVQFCNRNVLRLSVLNCVITAFHKQADE